MIVIREVTDLSGAFGFGVYRVAETGNAKARRGRQIRAVYYRRGKDDDRRMFGALAALLHGRGYAVFSEAEWREMAFVGDV